MTWRDWLVFALALLAVVLWGIAYELYLTWKLATL